MKIKAYSLVLLLISAASLCAGGPAAAKLSPAANLFFPANNQTTLVYESSFGETTSTLSGSRSAMVLSNQGDKFRYIQTLELKDDGLYVKDTYQYLKVFLFLKKENSIAYKHPLLRVPLPLEIGKSWKSEEIEYCGADSDKVEINGKIAGNETIATKAGTFHTIRIESELVNETGMKNKLTEWYAEGIGLVKVRVVVEGGGISGVLRDLLGYGEINFELKEIKKS